jgi:hypothetical protein
MRQVVVGFYISPDGDSCDEGNGIRDVMMSIDDPETAFPSGVLEPVYPPSDHQDLQAGQPGANP